MHNCKNCFYIYIVIKKLNKHSNKIQIKMANDKFKYTLQEANDKLKELAPIVTPQMKSAYHLISGTSSVTQWKWLKDGAPSIVSANHFVIWIEEYCKKNNVAA